MSDLHLTYWLLRGVLPIAIGVWLIASALLILALRKQG